MNISMKLVYQYMAIFFNFSPTSNHLHPIQSGNCDSNSRLVVDEDDNRKFRLQRVEDSIFFQNTMRPVGFYRKYYMLLIRIYIAAMLNEKKTVLGVVNI